MLYVYNEHISITICGNILGSSNIRQTIGLQIDAQDSVTGLLVRDGASKVEFHLRTFWLYPFFSGRLGLAVTMI